MATLKARIKVITDERREFEKAREKAIRLAEKLQDCGKENYKGITKIRPKCVEMEDGTKAACEKCLKIWLTNHPGME